MQTFQLSNQEAAQTGFTHKAVLNFADGDFSAAALTQAFNLMPLAIGQMVNKVAMYLATQLTGPTTATVAVGDGSSATGYLTAQSVLTGATPIVAAAGNGTLLNQAAGKAYTAADNVIATITTTGTNVSTITAGVIVIFVNIVDLTLL